MRAKRVSSGGQASARDGAGLLGLLEEVSGLEIALSEQERGRWS